MKAKFTTESIAFRTFPLEYQIWAIIISVTAMTEGMEGCYVLGKNLSRAQNSIIGDITKNKSTPGQK